MPPPLPSVTAYAAFSAPVETVGVPHTALAGQRRRPHGAFAGIRVVNV